MDRQSSNRQQWWRSNHAGSDLDQAGAKTQEETLSRRKIFKKAAGVAVVGAAGGAVLAEAFPTSARAAGGTTVEPGGFAPAVVALTDASTIAVDASLGNDFRVTIGANRIMGSPANPTDGQKITFQITQGTGGSLTITWGSSFEFSAGLPQPTLSTAAGQTDLLAFIYNAAKSAWLLAACVNGFATSQGSSPSPSVSPSTSPTISPSSSPTMTSGVYRLFPSTNGPSSPVSYSGPFEAGVLFEVTTGGTWLQGFWWWVCPSGQPTSAQTFALWAVYGNSQGGLVSAATVASGALTAGQWNYVPLTTPVSLAQGVCYNACTAFTGSFPVTNGEYAAGGPYSAGIVNGALSAFSDQSGSLPAPFSMPQGVFGVGTTDPTKGMPSDGSQSDNFWVDLQVTTTPPSAATYRLWPSYPTLAGAATGETTAYTLANEVKLTALATLDNIWFYSPPGAQSLPTRCAIWSVGSQSVVAGTDNTSPSWSGTAGSGWISCPYSGVTLPVGDYKVSVFYGGGTEWFLVTLNYWGSGGPGASGITAGPLTAPSTSSATSPGQSTYNQGSWAYPQSYGSGGGGENFWVDLEVTPS